MSSKSNTEPTTAKRRGRPSGRTAEQTRKLLVDAAGQEFAARPFAEVSMEQIALKAGLSGPAIYNHFASKDDLFAAAFKQRVQVYHRTITAAVAIQGSWKAKYNNLLRAVRPLQETNSSFQMINASVVSRLRNAPEKAGEIRAAREGFALVFRGLIDEAVACGDLPSDTDTTIAGDLLMAITIGAINTVAFYHSELDSVDPIITSLQALLGTNSN